MNRKTREVTFRKLQADLDSVQLQAPSDQYLPPLDESIPDLVADFPGKFVLEGSFSQTIFAQTQNKA
jgi:hypothetical protein